MFFFDGIRSRIFIFYSLLIFSLLPSLCFSATSADYYRAGLKLYNDRQYGQAETYLKAAIQVDPNNWEAEQVLGFCYYREGRTGEAKTVLQQSLDHHPDNPSLRKFVNSLGGTATNNSTSASPAVSPVIGGGNFGLGLVVGSPGDFGATGKYWLDNQNAFQGALKINGGTVAQFQYLWHDYDLVHPSSGAMPFYIGVGGDLAFGGGTVAIAGCAPIGLTYLFQKTSIPIDLFVEGVPTLWFFSGGTSFQLYADLGARYYF
ncbi:MAG TPA: tetratricopeptide repeat protein [bacterium]|nr:tetratricopeptide repeat protein [bacterium]